MSNSWRSTGQEFHAEMILKMNPLALHFSSVNEELIIIRKMNPSPFPLMETIRTEINLSYKTKMDLLLNRLVF